MNVLVADKIGAEGISGLKQLGCEVTVAPDAAGDVLVESVRQCQCQILVVRGTKVPAPVIQASRGLGLIVRVGAGFDSIDVETASRESVFVANCPGKNAAAVAELAFGLILALDRRIPDNVLDLRQGRWQKKLYSKARGLRGRTLGIIGLGTIGTLVARRALAFEMNVVAWSRSLTSRAASALGVMQVELPEEVAAGSDIVSVHLASNPHTRHLVGRKVFNEMKPGSFFINTARSDVVDYEALNQAIQEKKLRVGLDVFASEPSGGDASFTDPIVQMDGVIYGTHHIGASTQEAQDAAAGEMVSIVNHYLHSGEVKNCVNLSHGKIAPALVMVRHHNRPGILARVLGEVARHGLNVREMENVLCEGEKSACAQIRLDSQPDDTLLEDIAKIDPENILGVSMTRKS